MRILVAPDKFEGTLSAIEACDAIVSGWHDTAPRDVLVTQPMADGGPGFLAALASAFGALPTPVSTVGPHGDPVIAQLLMVPGPPVTAYLEAAQCCGLSLAPRPRRALEASSSGLAAMLEAALDAGAARVVVGVGGTASTDGGRPVVDAWQQPWPEDVELVVATDVANPLLGPAGAARVFGPQKGAGAGDVPALEQRLSAWAASAEVDPNAPGAGAGGGLAYGLMRLGARRVSGAALVADAVRLSEAAAGVDLVLTGEGRLDRTSLRGKVVGHVLRVSAAVSRPCVVVAGTSILGRGEAARAGIADVIALTDTVSTEAARKYALGAVRRVAGQVARRWSQR